MHSVTVHEAKTHLSKLIEEALEGRGSRHLSRRKPGALRGKLKVGPEFAEPPWADELSGWE
jgi:hypothetical protein